MRVIRISRDGVLELAVGPRPSYACDECGSSSWIAMDEYFYLENIRERLKIRLTEEQLQEFVDLTNKITEEDMGAVTWNSAWSHAHVIYNRGVYQHHFFPVFDQGTPVESEFILEKHTPFATDSVNVTARAHMIEIVRHLIELSSTTLEWYH